MIFSLNVIYFSYQGPRSTITKELEALDMNKKGKAALKDKRNE